jgi:hypothetical protein
VQYVRLRRKLKGARYGAIGSGGGIAAITDRTVDDGDRDDQLKK